MDSVASIHSFQNIYWAFAIAKYYDEPRSEQEKQSQPLGNVYGSEEKRTLNNCDIYYEEVVWVIMTEYLPTEGFPSPAGSEKVILRVWCLKCGGQIIARRRR